MNFLHVDLNAIQRSKGRSSIAAVAYVTASKIHDTRQNQVFDYTRKERVIDTGFIGPKSLDQNTFWNKNENHHKRGDATTARTMEVALPKEVPEYEAAKYAEDMAKEIAKRYDVAVTWALHISKDKNLHVHFVMSSCRVFENGDLGKKVEELDPIHCKRNGIENAAEVLRPWAAEYINQMMTDHGIEGQVDHRSFAARGLPTIPTIHEGFGPEAEARRMENEERRRINKLILAREQENAEPDQETINAVFLGKLFNAYHFGASYPDEVPKGFIVPERNSEWVLKALKNYEEEPELFSEKESKAKTDLRQSRIQFIHNLQRWEATGLGPVPKRPEGYVFNANLAPAWEIRANRMLDDLERKEKERNIKRGTGGFDDGR